MSRNFNRQMTNHQKRGGGPVYLMVCLHNCDICRPEVSSTFIARGGEDLSIFREIGENLLIKSFKIGLFCLKLRNFRKIHDKIGLFSFWSRGKFINLQNPARENLYVA